MVDFARNWKDKKTGKENPPLNRIESSRFVMPPISKEQKQVSYNTQKLLGNETGRPVEKKDAKSMTHNAINRIDRTVNLVHPKWADELEIMRSTLVAFQGQEPNDAMFDELKEIHKRITDIETM